MNRVVVTGMAAFTPIGCDWITVANNLKHGNSGIEFIEAWNRYDGLRTRLGGPVKDFTLPGHYTRKVTRSMGRVAKMATFATELALTDAKLLGSDIITNGETGISFGSSSGSPDAIRDFGNMQLHNKVEGINANTYIKMMAHTTAVNICVHFKVKGRVITTSSACTSGSQGVGYAYEAIKYGSQTVMIAGGAEELDATQAAVFDTLFATSVCNDNPKSSPRPFDRDRDGLVIGEGAGALILEEYEHAKRRGAKIYAEIVGYHCNSDGSHITQPNRETMQIAMAKALQNADLQPSQIGYINAHGTATDRGDRAESVATYNIFGDKTPISSLKSYMGHTLGACGAIEAWASINMMNEGWYCQTLNLENPDDDCASLHYIMGDAEHFDSQYVMSNNFAFGGINTSLIFRKIDS